MAYDDKLASRIRKRLAHRKNIVEKKMFGGLALGLAHGRGFGKAAETSSCFCLLVAGEVTCNHCCCRTGCAIF